MNLHEYQARELLRRAGVPVPPGEVATTPAEAKAATERLGNGKVVIKAQVHAGGRGKAGGVKLADNPDQAADVAYVLGSGKRGRAYVIERDGMLFKSSIAWFSLMAPRDCSKLR